MRAFDPAAGSFAAWLRGIAVNVLRNQFRRECRHARRTQPLDEHCEAVMQPRSPPDDDAERIAAALCAVPEHYEAVLRMKYLEGMSVAAIAEARRESSKAIESLLTRARQAFRQAYLEAE
jgi:RNA polymerase sigma-70 factor (ECF subfamily)